MSQSTALPPWKRRLPNQLTWGRIAITPLIMLCMWLNTPVGDLLATLLFLAGSISDFFDGHLARKYNASTTVGKFLDPLADKILVSSILIMFVADTRVDPYMVVILLARDTIIGGIRSMAAADNIIISARPLGKWKTALQMIFIPALLIRIPELNLPLAQVGYWGLWGSVVLSLISGWEYAAGYFFANKVSD